MKKWMEQAKELWQRRSEWPEQAKKLWVEREGWKTRAKELWQRRNVKIAVVCIALLALFIVVTQGLGRSQIVPDSAHRCAVERGDLVVSILQSGELEAKRSREILNEASRDAKIVDIVEDGSVVTNGQLLVELESAELADRYLEQKSATATAEADLLHSQEALQIAKLKHATDVQSAILKVELAELELKKYVEAEYPQQLLKAQSGILVAEQELKKARSDLEGTEELYEKDYVNRQDYEEAQDRVNQKEIDVRNLKKDLEILQDYTYGGTLKELENAVANAKSSLEQLEKSFAAELAQNESRIEAQKTALEIQKNQLVTREKELKNTTIYADFNGQVFYPNERRQTKIEKGATINFRQRILSYPDLNAWNLKIGIPEAMIDKVAIGQEAVATLDAVPGLVLKGRVDRISAVPDSQNWFNTGVKTYTIMVDVTSKTAAKLKPGMSATVEIVTDELHDILYVPIQAVVSNKEKHYVYVIKHKRKKLREVQIGKYNTQFIEIVDGLSRGEKLLLYAEVELNADAKLKKSPLNEDNKRTEEQGQG